MPMCLNDPQNSVRLYFKENMILNCCELGKLWCLEKNNKIQLCGCGMSCTAATSSKKPHENRLRNE